MSNQNPKVYSGKIFHIEKTEHKDIIIHPGVAVILPLLDPHQIVMIRNRRVAVNETLWELPAGTLEEDELPLMCAKRELLEETGFRAKEIKPLLEFYTSPGISNEKVWSFVATDLTLKERKLQPGEEIEVKIVTWTDAMEMLKKGEIVDAKTIATLMYYILY